MRSPACGLELQRYLERHIPVENISKEEVVLMKNARTESLVSPSCRFRRLFPSMALRFCTS